MKKKIKPELHVYPLDRGNKKDKKNAKILEKVINSEWEDKRGILEAIISARNYIELLCPIKTPDGIWDRIVREVVLRDIERSKSLTKEENI